MANRLYIVPVIGDGTSASPRRPKYFADGTVPRIYSAMDFGFEPWMIVGANLSTANHSTVAGFADVSALPVNLAATLTGGQVNATQAFLESANIPAGWVTTSLTWVQVLRIVLGIFSFFQGFGTIHHQRTGNVPPSIFGGGVTLSTTFGSLPLAIRGSLSATADDQGIDTAGITGSTTLRSMLKTLGDHYVNRSLSINGIVI